VIGLSAALLEIADELADHGIDSVGNDLLRDCRRIAACFILSLCSAQPRHADQNQSASADTCFVSANRTCELGMRQTTGRVYESFVYALEGSSREIK
jgi:hypothetical protein